MSEIGMETNAQVINETEKPINKKSLPRWLVIAFAIQLALNIFFVIEIISFSNLQKLANTAIQKVDKINTTMNETTDKLNAMIESNKKNYEYIERLNISSAINSGYIVTDKIVVQNGRMSLGNNTITIDIMPQPNFARYFEGQGKINLADRELRSTLEEVIFQLNQLYDNYNKSLSMPKFDELEITITERGYNVASHKNGRIILAGEN